MTNKTLPSIINILGTIMTLISYLILALMVFQVFYTMIPNTIEKFPETGLALGAVIGSLFAVFAVLFVPFKFAKLHSNLKKYLDGKVPQKKFSRNYVICWALSVIIIFGSLFSRSMAVIVTFIVLLLIPFIYLLLTHKYTKKTYEYNIQNNSPDN